MQDPDLRRGADATHEGETASGSVAERVGEEVRDAHDRLEATVEQVLPARARWSAGRIAWLILGTLLAIVVLLVGGTVWYVASHSEWAAGRLTTLVNRSLAERSNLVLEVRDLRGNPFKQVTALDARLTFRDGKWPPLLVAPSLTLRYAPWDLWFGHRRSLEVEIDRPVVRLTRGPDGRLHLPEWRSGPKVSGPVRELELLFRVNGASVYMPDSSDDIVGWSFHGSAISARTNQVTIQDMAWARGPFASSLQRFAGSLSAGDSVQFRVQRLLTPDLSLQAIGGWRAGQAEKRAHVHVERVRWRWLAKAFDNDVFDVAGEGHATFELRQAAQANAPWTGTVQGAATWDSLPLSTQASLAYRGGRIVLPTLVLRSPAGNLNGSAAYDSRHFDIGGRVAHGDPARWGPIGLDGWPAGDLNGEFRYASQKLRPAGSQLRARLASSELAGWHADSAWVAVTAPSTAPDTFDVRLLRRGGQAVLGGRIDDHGWRGRWSARNFPLDEWPDGRASGLTGRMTDGSGTVSGQGGGLSATGTMRGTQTDWLGIHTAAWRLDGVAGRLLPTTDLALPSTHLTNLTFLGLHFDSAAAVLHVGDNRADLTRIVATAADTTVTASGVTDWTPGGWRVRLDQAEAASTHFHWVGEPPLLLSGNPRGTTFERFAAHDSSAHLAVEGRWAGPGGSYDWTARATALDLGRLGLPPELALAGSADAVLRVTGPSGNPTWNLDATATAPAMQGHRLPRAHIVAEGAKGRVDANAIDAAVGSGRVSGDLHFAGMSTPWPDTLTGDAVGRWLATAAGWHGGLRADSLQLDSLVSLIPAARGWNGTVQGSLAISGSPHAPELGLAAAAHPLGYGAVAADQVDLEARYAAGRLNVTRLLATRSGVTSSASGEMPIVIAFGHPVTVPDEPMRWRVDLDHADLGLLALFVPQIGEASGQLDLHAGIEGTPHHPSLSGAAHIGNGMVRLAGREEQVEQIAADFRFERDQALMDKLTAKQGKEGTISGSGTIDLTGMQLRNYLFTFALRNFTVKEEGLYAVTFDADRISVTRGTARVNGHYLPHVSGQINVRGATVFIDFANQTETQQLAASTAPLQWTYAITLKAANNVRWQPPNGDIEFSTDLTLEQTPRALNAFGDLTAIRGYYDFLSNRFTVRKADLNFDNVGGLNPLIDAEATARVVPVTNLSGVRAINTEDQPHNVTVSITGRADHPAIDFESVPGDWDQARILRELTVGRFLGSTGNVASALQDPLDSWLTQKINDQLSPALGKTFRADVGQWRLERDQGGVAFGQGDVYVVLGKQISPRVLVNLKQRVPGFERPVDPSLVPNPVERNIEAEYRLNRFFYITTEVGQPHALAATTTPRAAYNVNLHARWEY